MDKRIASKIEMQPSHEKTIVFADFDGTLFTPGIQIGLAPYYNKKSSVILEKRHIPFIIVTGRSDWSKQAEIETTLLGLRPADAIIAGAGTIIYWRDRTGKLHIDPYWDQQIQETPVIMNNTPSTVWDTQVIIQTIKQVPLPQQIQFTQSPDKYLIRLYAKHIPIQQLHEFIERITHKFVSGIKVVYTEKLLQKNTTHIFSGNILIIPDTGGKEKATMYMLSILKRMSQHFSVYTFGDASIDIPFLTMRNTTEFTFHAYGVHLTPLARGDLTTIKKQYPQLEISDIPGPQTFYMVLKQLHTAYYSIAQNSYARILLKPFEGILDTIIDKQKTPNEISFYGLNLVKKSIDTFYNPSTSFFQRVAAWKGYLYGNLIDLFDGIRARQGEVQEANGQLVDGFCDRAKEFYQLYKRAQYYFDHKGHNEGYQTMLTAISCVLPSIARAQAEIMGISVQEHDSSGGSMFSRTKKLFYSLFLDTTGQHKRSFLIDKAIYQANLQTFTNRLQRADTTVAFILSLDEKILTSFQKKALERWLLYISLLQEEYILFTKYLTTYALDKKFQKETASFLSPFLSVPVIPQKNKWHFPPYHLTLHDVL